MAKNSASCHDVRPMKSRLCYAWFGDEDVKLVFSSLEKKIAGEGSGETARKTTFSYYGHHWEVRHEPPRTQAILKTP